MLSYLANITDNPVIVTLGPLIAFIAISSSFLGHFLGARESLKSLIAKPTGLPLAKADKLGIALMFFAIWGAAIINPGILGLMETLSGPVIAMILFIMPVVAIYKVGGAGPLPSPLGQRLHPADRCPGGLGPAVQPAEISQAVSIKQERRPGVALLLLLSGCLARLTPAWRRSPPPARGWRSPRRHPGDRSRSAETPTGWGLSAWGKFTTATIWRPTRSSGR